jgi:L-seryl-tRNA(Ser) seleniumtransferase
MSDDQSVYDEWDVRTVVNASGTKTRIGGSRIRPEALDAMRSAAGSFVDLADLQALASERIASITGAEAGFVTSGAAAGLQLAAAAAIAGYDVGVVADLPETTDVADEIVMPRTHRTGYDHALRAAGATIVDVGTNDPCLGTGSTNLEPWELDRAITDDTAAVAYVQKSYSSPPLETVADVAHDNDVPVIVDAAAEVPPVDNLSAFVESGADVVVFSGGKGIRGPQTTGIVAGRQRYVESIAVQQLDMHVPAELWDPPRSLVDPDNFDGVPRQGIGRPMKVGKEELAGLLRALELFVEEDHAELGETWERTAQRLAEALRDVGLPVDVEPADGTSRAPVVVATVEEEAHGLSARGLVAALRAEDPRVYVGADRVPAGEITLNPICLEEDEVDYVVERVAANVQ